MNDRLTCSILLLAILAVGMTHAADNVAPRPIYYFDLTELNSLKLSDPAQARRAWDTLHLAASVQGIVNREDANLFLRFMPHPDDFWWKQLREPGKWLDGRPVVEIDSIETLLRTFQDQLTGTVVYRERPHVLSNLASTIAGVENRACLRYSSETDSLYQRVQRLDLPGLGDEFRLFLEDGRPRFAPDSQGVIGETDLPTTGSVKCDAYLWAKQRYLDSGKTSPVDMAYYIDSFWLTSPTKSGLSNCTLTNHDFFIARGAFFFDLHVWPEESPVDDPGQAPGTDLATLRRLLRSQHARADGQVLHIGGFTPWTWKYTDNSGAGSAHGGVDTEWQYAKVISSYDGVMDADALGYSGLVNASFYQHFPLKDRYPQHARPTVDDLKRRGFLDKDGRVAPHVYATFYMGDYDSAAWLTYHVPKWWNDPARGEIPCNWAFNPNLDRRAPHVIDYARQNATKSDWFISGDCGAGYLNPGMLAASQRDESIGDGWETWTEHNRAYFDRYDLTITGFVIDGHSPGMGPRGLDAYAVFSPDGLIGQKIPHLTIHNGVMPVIGMRTDLYGRPADAGRRIAELIDTSQRGPQFLPIRTILQSPSWHRATMSAAGTSPGGKRLRFVDAHTFMLLLKTHLAAGNP